MTSTTQKTIILKRCGPCPDFASWTLAFALHLRESTEKPQSELKNLSQGKKTSVRVAVHDSGRWVSFCDFLWTWCFCDRASWFDYILITNLMHWLLFIHKILFSSTCSEPQVLIFRRIQLYTCSIWYRHSLWEFLVACRYTAWVRTDCREKVVGGCLKTPTNNLTIKSEKRSKVCQLREFV